MMGLMPLTPDIALYQIAEFHKKQQHHRDNTAIIQKTVEETESRLDSNGRVNVNTASETFFSSGTLKQFYLWAIKQIWHGPVDKVTTLLI